MRLLIKPRELLGPFRTWAGASPPARAQAQLRGQGWSCAPLPAAGADGDNALAARRWRVLRGFPAVTCLEIIAFLPLQPVGMSLHCGSPKSHTLAGGNLSCRAGLQLKILVYNCSVLCENTRIFKKSFCFKYIISY